MNPRAAPIPLAPALYLLALSAYKAFILTGSMMADWLSILPLWAMDFPYIVVTLLLAPGAARSGHRWVRALLRVALLSLMGFYLIDTITVLELDAHANLFDIARYSVEWRVAMTFVDGRVVIAALLLLPALALSGPRSPTLGRRSLSVLLALSLAGGLALYLGPPALTRYSVFNPTQLVSAYRQQPPAGAERYSQQQIDFYTSLKLPDATIPQARPNIILVIVESLSAINSHKVSGVGHLLDRFDALAAHGVLFTNFFANHQASEGGIISLLSGFAPIHFPTASPYMFDEFATMPSVLAQYRRQGYYTEFLTNAELQFIGLDHYLAGLAIDRSRGRDEVDVLRRARRVVQDAPPDSLLYTEALTTLASLQHSHQPYLLTLATTSTHLPYTHPDNGPDTAAAVWDWSLQQLTGFYQQLRAKGFFDNGILLITGDHRQMRPLTQVETRRYGDSAKARIPLLIIGPHYRPDTTDTRFFQQADLLRYLGKIPFADAPLSPHPIWVERYNRKYGHIELIDNLGIFDETDQGRREYRLKMSGSRIQWQTEKPPFAREITTRIHAQRSLHQYLRTQNPPPP